MLILKIIGWVALAVVAFVVLAGLWFWRQLKAAAKADTMPFPPARVNLEPEENPAWRNEKEVLKLAADFRALGFEQTGVFSIPEIGGTYLVGLVHVTERFYGCVYDYAVTAPTFDFFAELGNDEDLTGTNSTIGAHLDQRPGELKVRVKDGSVAEVWDAVRAHARAPGRLEVARDGFVETFKKGYARSMAWSLRQGGPSKESMRRQAQLDKIELTDEELEEAYQDSRRGYRQQLQKACIAEYLDQNKIQLVEWERIHHRAFAIPETLSLKEVVETIELTGYLDEEQEHALKKVEGSFSESGIDLAKKIITQNVGGMGLKQLGEVSEPVPAWILLLPDANEREAFKVAA